MQKIAKLAWRDFKQHIEDCKPTAKHLIKYSIAAVAFERSGILLGPYLALGAVFLGAIKLVIEDEENLAAEELNLVQNQDMELRQIQNKFLVHEELKMRFAQNHQEIV